MIRNSKLKTIAKQCIRSLPNNEYKKNLLYFYEDAAKNRNKWIDKNYYYYSEHYKYMKYLIPEGMNVLEIGSGTGRLLNHLRPLNGVGIDISSEMVQISKNNYPHLNFIEGDIEDESTLLIIKDKFDYIIISDTIGYLIDCQKTFENLQKFCNKETRIIISYYSWLWEPALKFAEKIGQKMPQPQMNWLSTDTISNLLYLSSYKVIKREWRQLCPKKFFGLGTLLNRYIGTLPLIRKICLRNYIVARPILNSYVQHESLSVSIIIPCRNEEGNIEPAIKRIPEFTSNMEIIFVEGNSKDNTKSEIQRIIRKYPEKDITMLVQDGVGKWDAVRKAFEYANNDILMILDADLTTPPEELPKFYNVILSGKGEFVNGSRMVYPMENEAMRLLNFWANSIFSYLFTWILNQKYTDTLCGTKVLSRKNYENISKRYGEYSVYDPFGDFYLIFGANRENLHTVEIPIRYAARGYGETQISRFRHGLVLARMVLLAYRRFKAF